MSSTMKLSLLALVSTVAAIPQAGGYGHSKFHSAVKASETQGAGYPVNTPAGYVPQGQGYPTNPKASSSAGYPAGYPVDNTPKPSSSAGYPVGYPVDNTGSKPVPSAGYPTGYPVGYNSTGPYPTGPRPGSGYETTDITVDITKTSTTTIVKTVHVTPSPVGQQSAPASNYATSPAAVGQAVPSAGNDQCGPATVTVTAKEVVTVTVGGNKNEPSSYVQAPPSKPTPAESKPVEYPVASSKPAESKPAEYPAVTPKPAESKPAGYPVASSKPAEAVPYKADVPASSAAPSAGYTSSTGYSGAKRGLVYNDASLVKALSGSYKYGFAWNWGQVENNDIGVPFMPAMPRPAVSSVEEWMANVDKAVKKGSKAVMGFNECDHKEQCNMEVVEACAAWKKYMNPIKEKYPDVYIVGPSVTNGPAPMGLDWLTRFHAACPDAKIDGTNIHFYSKYDDATNNKYSYTIDRFKLQVETAAKNYGMPVWVTEYGLEAGTATPEQAASFLKQTMQYMDGSANVSGYSYFKVGNDQDQYQLCSGTGPSALGKVYATS